MPDGRRVHESEPHVLVHVHRRVFSVGHYFLLDAARTDMHAELLFCDRRARHRYTGRVWHRHHTRRHLCLLRRAPVRIANVFFTRT